MSFPRRGELYWVSLDPALGTEIQKTRPALILSNDVGNEYSRRVIVAPITSRNLDKIHPIEVLVPAPSGGLKQDSKVLLDQLRSVDKMRLRQRIGSLSESLLQEVERALRLTFDLD
ncbi:type II toxin-antitoxin system PemK/MazF family toxin [bacterium CPR1]|nr:type II toxin-antitoxin system PemK/MazF family toxin [bacterium CPR1]